VNDLLQLSVALLLVNIIGFFVMGEDKRRAKKQQYRISEQTLWLLAIIGGAPAMTIAMNQFRHKTKHVQFKIGFPLVALLQVVLYIYFLVK